MFTKGYSRRVGLHNWEPSGLATGEAIRRGKEELQVSAERCVGAASGDSRGPFREQSGPGCGGTVKERKLWRLGGDGRGRAVRRGQQVTAAGSGPVGSPAADARPRGCPAVRSSPAQEAAQQQQSVPVTRSLEKGKLSCEKINIISSRI